jgi:hypothetical protein
MDPELIFKTKFLSLVADSRNVKVGLYADYKQVLSSGVVHVLYIYIGGCPMIHFIQFEFL